MQNQSSFRILLFFLIFFSVNQVSFIKSQCLITIDLDKEREGFLVFYKDLQDLLSEIRKSPENQHLNSKVNHVDQSVKQVLGQFNKIKNMVNKNNMISISLSEKDLCCIAILMVAYCCMRNK